MIYAGLDGIKNELELPYVSDINLYKADDETLKKYRKLPADLKSACAAAAESSFIKKHIPVSILDIYCNK